MIHCKVSVNMSYLDRLSETLLNNERFVFVRIFVSKKILTISEIILLPMVIV